MVEGRWRWKWEVGGVEGGAEGEGEADSPAAPHLPPPPSQSCGELALQEAAAMIPALALAPLAYHRVLDLCAVTAACARCVLVGSPQLATPSSCGWLGQWGLGRAPHSGREVVPLRAQGEAEPRTQASKQWWMTGLAILRPLEGRRSNCSI